MFLELAITEFRIWLAPKKLSPATLRAYDQDLRLICDLLASELGESASDVKLDDLSIQNIRSAFATFSDNHSKSSILRTHSTWNQFFEFLVSDGKASGNPMAAVNRPKAEPRSPKPLDGWAEDTVPNLLRSLSSSADEQSQQTKGRERNPWPERDLAIVATLLATGSRSSELLQINIGSLAGARGEQVVQVIGKGSKPRAIPIEPELDELLGTYLESRKARFVNWKPKETDALFIASNGKRLTANQLYYLIDRCLRAAGLSNRRPTGAMAHAFRHTYGTTLAAEGAPVSAIRKLMGHSSITTSQGYIDSLAREERSVAAQNRVYDVLHHLSQND